MIGKLKLLVGGALCLSFFLASCSEEQTIFQLSNDIDIAALNAFEKGKLDVRGKVILETNEDWGAINANIPPKFIGDHIFIITGKNVVLRYRFQPKGKLKAEFVAQLPKVYEMVSDFLPENDSVISFCSNIGIYSITEINTRTNKITSIKTDTTMCHSIPFLGLSLRKYQDQYLFPMVRVNDSNEKGNFLSIYNKHKGYEYGLGDFSLFDEKAFSPYFDSPVMSEVNNGVFYVSSTSSNGAVKCNLKRDGDQITLEPLNTVSFSKQTFNRFKGKMSQSDLGDFGVMEKSYVTDCYVVGLYQCKNSLIRISKRKQPFMNPESATKNPLMNAPWTMEVVDLNSKKGIICEVEKERFCFTNAFVRHNQFFVLSNQSNQHEIIYQALR